MSFAMSFIPRRMERSQRLRRMLRRERNRGYVERAKVLVRKGTRVHLEETVMIETSRLKC